MTFQLPIVLYLFVLAIGTDYNVLMIARLREEARAGNEPRVAAALAVRHAGPSVAAAGLISRPRRSNPRYRSSQTDPPGGARPDAADRAGTKPR